MADREIKAGDRLIASRNLDHSGIKKGDIVTVKRPLLRWPCQNFHAEGFGDKEFAHQQFEHPMFQIGDLVRCFEVGYASYGIGDEGKVIEIRSDDTFRLTKTAKGGWHRMKHFKLVKSAEEQQMEGSACMSDEEWESYEGWLNEATYHGALCFFNDGKAMQKLDDKLLNSESLLSVQSVTDFITLPSGRGLKKSDIDVWSIQYERALELYEEGRINQEEWDRLRRKTFVSKYSGTCQRRLALLKKAGFDTDNHFFLDYRKGVTPMGKLNTFEIGDKVKLVDNYMDVSDARTESNHYAIDNKIIPGVIYEVSRVGDESFKVQDKGYWMNPRQFKLADEATIMSKEDTMKKLKIETITYVNDTNVTEYDALSQAQMVEKYEAEIARLEAFTTKPKKVVALIEEMKADLAAVVAAFDAVEED